MWVTGEASVMPYPWRMGMPVEVVKRRARSGASGAAPHFTQRRLCSRGNFPASQAWQYASNAGGTQSAMVTPSSTMVLKEASQSKRGIKTTVQPRMKVMYERVAGIDVHKD